MKFSSTAVVLFITLLFCAFLVGFWLGRTTDTGDIFVSAHPDDTSAATLSDTSASNAKININTASLAQLCTLDGISGTLAQRIIDYRETFGPFRSTAELTEVDGIGQKILDKLADRITI